MLRETRREVLEKYKESVELNAELVNNLTGRIEELVAKVKELNDILIWGINHYNANEKILERYRTDENGSSKDTTGDNKNSW